MSDIQRELDARRPFGDAISKIGEGDGLDILVKADQDGATVTAQGEKTLGKGWSVAGAVAWTKDQWAAWTGLSWRPK